MDIIRKFVVAELGVAQFYDNVFLGGTPGGLEELTIKVPYPWVTQGANAIQVHDTVSPTTINGKTCFVPGPDISSAFTTASCRRTWSGAS